MATRQASRTQEQKSPKGHQGFASMDEARQREIASKGGHAAHERGTAHEFTSEEARVAGRKGGEAVSENRQHMAEIGRKGGEQSHRGDRRAEPQKAHGHHEKLLAAEKREGDEPESEEENEEEEEEISKTGQP